MMVESAIIRGKIMIKNVDRNQHYEPSVQHAEIGGKIEDKF